MNKKPTPGVREDWDDYFMKLTLLIANRSTCLRRHVGALLVKEHRILATGYNGAPPGIPHCLDTGCLRQQMSIPSGERSELCRAIHAEQNALMQCASFGIPAEGATLYCTYFPCTHCIKSLLSVKISRIVYQHDYHDDLGKTLLSQSQPKVIIDRWAPQPDPFSD
ncbi:MAG: dCMP deaminase family protein [Puniceicoccales bacterium]|jgi:dCMP deaminase|nr:dCMP deaminase family protein [Puniceicoccales bacterium]